MVAKEQPIVRTRGFGVPLAEIDPQRFVVRLSESAATAVMIIEDYGVTGAPSTGLTPDHLEHDQIVRCRLDARRWRAIAGPCRRVFNERLKPKRMEAAKWEPGDNPVHRLLGRELCVLAWAIEACAAELIPIAVKSWEALRPEERWWLYAMAAHRHGAASDTDKGWRKAIRIGLTEGDGTVPAPKDRQLNFDDL